MHQDEHNLSLTGYGCFVTTNNQTDDQIPKPVGNDLIVEHFSLLSSPVAFLEVSEARQLCLTRSDGWSDGLERNLA